MPARAAHLRGVAIDPARRGHGWNGDGPYTRRPPPPRPEYAPRLRQTEIASGTPRPRELYGYGMEMARTHATRRPPAPSTPRDYGRPRSRLERPDPENSRPHTGTETEYGMPPPQEL